MVSPGCTPLMMACVCTGVKRTRFWGGRSSGYGPGSRGVYDSTTSLRGGAAEPAPAASPSAASPALRLPLPAPLPSSSSLSGGKVMRKGRSRRSLREPLTNSSSQPGNASRTWSVGVGGQVGGASNIAEPVCTWGRWGQHYQRRRITTCPHPSIPPTHARTRVQEGVLEVHRLQAAVHVLVLRRNRGQGSAG